jgi:serine phosphatase RsbU (regulator of sigma subunit)/energy-coupling factor transporter transmembrane protein EcfT
VIRRWITRTFSGRAMTAGVVIKVIAYVLRLLAGAQPLFEVTDTIGDVALVAGALVVGFHLFVDAKRVLLWRVRRKLTLSYIFIGFVPALLIIIFFLVSGLLLFFNIAAYMTRKQIGELIDETRFFAESAGLELQQARTPADITDVLRRRQEAVASRYNGASFAFVPASKTCGARSVALAAAPAPVTVGPWSHAAAPVSVPAWVPCSGYADVLPTMGTLETRVATRAAVYVDGAPFAVIVDVPVGEKFASDLREDGITLGNVTPRSAVEGESGDAQGSARDRIVLGRDSIGGRDESGGLPWVALVDYADWSTGNTSLLAISIRTVLATVYERISVSSVTRPLGNSDFGNYLLGVLAIVGILFLIIQAVAFGMGLALARSITGSVHELFAGTERIRRGDFTGKIAIRSRDQLGELADSFNSMTASIEDLLQQKAVKERLEQELRIARSIQMSLLPQGPLVMSGLSLTAHCEPAREVGGDYYDFLPINDHTIGILIADVSGKGTSAALYMAELKGIVLSLSQRHTSPRALLIEADHIISRHLDSRSFITVTYLLVDLRAGTLRYARAGHCPLIYMPGSYVTERAPQLVAPDGLVLGLQLDEGVTFTRLLEEVTLPLGPGDLFMLYTDGLSEAMNPEGDCFGDARLADLVGAHPDLPANQLRERILREIAAFAGTAPQHDDMTMVLLRVDEVGDPVGVSA